MIVVMLVTILYRISSHSDPQGKSVINGTPHGSNMRLFCINTLFPSSGLGLIGLVPMVSVGCLECAN